MSRSTKRPFITDQQRGCSKKAKRNATRKVRKSKDVANGSAYKKESCSWNIRDYSFFCPQIKKAHRK